MESGENNDVPGQSSSNSDSASDIDDEFEEFEEEEETVENDEDVVEENEVDEDRDLMDEDDWENEPLLIVNNNVAAYQRRDPSSDEDERDADQEQDPENREEFDSALPIQHAYLGAAMELSGRTILEENLVQELVIFYHPTVILMPGQTVPLTVMSPQHISAMKSIIQMTKTFGSVYRKSYQDIRSLPDRSVEIEIGTTAEIYAYREPDPDGLEIGFHVKVKGRQRFQVLSSRQQVDGIVIATVKILPEVVLSNPLYPTRLKSMDRFRPPPEDTFETSDEDEDGSVTNDEATEQPSTSDAKPTKRRSRHSKLRSSFSELMARLMPRDKSKDMQNKPEFTPKQKSFKTSVHNHFRTRIYSAPLTPLPNWVYEMYCSEVLVERVHAVLVSLKLFSHRQIKLPTDPIELSFWVATNFPFSNVDKLKLLEINNCIPRLHREIEVLKKVQTLVCSRCNDPIAKQEDIFSMSADGPQSAYVNPQGYVHETLTLYRCQGLQLVGQASTEYSWFPGYAWTIANCRNCSRHMGWRFTAINSKLVPKKFWGISRQSLKPQMEFETEMEDEEDGDLEGGVFSIG